MKERDIKKGLIVIPISRARHYITSLQQIIPSRRLEIMEEGTDWCVDNNQIAKGPLLDRLCGIVGRNMKSGVGRGVERKCVPNPGASLNIYSLEDVATVPEFLKRCWALKMEHDRKQEIIQKENETRAALYRRLKTLGLQVELDGTTVKFKNLVDLETLVEALELFCADTLHALFGSKPKTTGE